MEDVQAQFSIIGMWNSMTWVGKGVVIVLLIMSAWSLTIAIERLIRFQNAKKQSLAVALGIFPPFIGPLLYMLFRPPEYVEDVRERELEIKAMEESLDTSDRCPVCRAAIDASFIACPVCTTKLKDSCRRCKAPLEPLWQMCPYCETPVESPRAVENL